MTGMFFKKDKLLEEYQNEAAAIFSCLEQLTYLIDDIKQTKLASQPNGMQQTTLHEFRSAVLSIKPAVKPIERQLNITCQIKRLKNAIHYELLTIKRNALLNNISSLQIDLYLICMRAQGLLAQNQHLINNIPDPAIKKMIGNITANKLHDIFLGLLTAYNLVSNSFTHCSNKLFSLVLPFSCELSTADESLQRIAISIDDSSLQQFNEVVALFSTITLFLSLEQFIESHPNEKHVLKQSLSTYWPIISEIEQAHKNFHAHCEQISLGIDAARLQARPLAKT